VSEIEIIDIKRRTVIPLAGAIIREDSPNLRRRNFPLISSGCCRFYRASVLNPSNVISIDTGVRR